MAAGETDREHNEVSVRRIYIMARRVRAGVKGQRNGFGEQLV